MYNLTDEERADLHTLAAGARKRSRIPHVADFARSYVLLEQAASSIAYHDAELIPALVQAPGYARDLLAQASIEGLDERVTERLSRSELLNGEDPPHLRVLLGEAALHRMPVSVDAAVEQLQHLIDMNKRDSVEVRILPFAAGLYPAVGVCFTLLKLVTPAITRVYLEGATTATMLHEPDETDLYEQRFERLWSSHALNRKQSDMLIRERIQQLG